MKSNRPPRSNMRWRTHKCLKTSWGNMHFCRRSRLTYWSSHCTKHRANVLLNYTSPVHKTLKRHCSQNESYCHCLTLLLHTHWQSDINHPPSTSPVIQSVCAHVVPAFLWWTTGGKNNLPLQLFPPELPGNIIKKGWVWVALMPAAMLQLPSGCHLLPHCKAASTSDLFFFFSGWLLHHPCSRHADRPAWEIHRDDPKRKRHALRWLILKMEFLLHLLGYEITDVYQELSPKYSDGCYRR